MNKKFVRGFALLLVILMCLSLLPLAARAEEYDALTEYAQIEGSEIIQPTCGENGAVYVNGQLMQILEPTGQHVFESIVSDDYLIEESDDFCLNPSLYWKSCAVCGVPAEEAYYIAVGRMEQELYDRLQNGEQFDHETLRENLRKEIYDNYTFKYGGNGHAWHEYEAQEPTCEQEGWSAYRQCDNCDALSGYVPVPATGHRWGEYSVTMAPTCTETGSEKRVCEFCGKEEVLEIPALGHTYGEYTVTKAPTCTENGEQERVCAECGYVDVAVIPALGHSYGEYTVTKEATCTEDGEQERVCAECGYVDKAVIPAGHKFGEFVVTVEPNCHASGEQERECTVCHEKETESIPPAHKFGEFVVTQEPTCYSTGAETSTCEVCGEQEVRWIDKVPHKYENGVCVYCGEAEPNAAAETVSDFEEELPEDSESFDGEPESWIAAPTVLLEAAAAETVSDFVSMASARGLSADDPANLEIRNATPLKEDGSRMSNEEVEALGGVSFEMPLPTNYKEGDPIRVYHRNSDTGEWELVAIDDFVIRDGMVVITATHFSPFAILVESYPESAATYDSGPFTLSFDANGGSGDAMASKTGTEGEKITLPTCTYTRDGYNFAGWNTSADGSGSGYGDVDNPNGASFTFYASQKLYAQWAKVVIIKYDPNGGSPKDAVEQKVSQGATINLRDGSELSRTYTDGRNYKFTGWNLLQDGTKDDYETHFDPGAAVTVNTGTTLYAEWAKPVTLKYMANKGYGYMADETGYFVGDEVTLTTNAYLRDGMEFAEWNIDPEGSGLPYEDGEEDVYLWDDLTLYAQWGDRITITYYPNGGDGYMEPQFAAAGYYFELKPCTFTRDRYTFKGWNTSETGYGTHYDDKDYIYLNTDTSLYAEWEQNEFDVKFYDGDTELTDKEMHITERGTVVELPDYTEFDPSAHGSDLFIGWSLTKGSTSASYVPGDGFTPTSDATFYAVFRESVTVTFHATEFDSEEKIYNIVDDYVQVSPRGSGKLDAIQKMREEAGFYVPAGKHLKNWNTKPDDKGQKYSDRASVSLTADMELYSVWDDVETPAAPASVSLSKPIVNYDNKELLNGHAGTITGVDSTMQYSVEGGSWADVGDTSTKLPTKPVNWEFRYKATEATPASDSVVIPVTSYISEASKPVDVSDLTTEKYQYAVKLTEVKRSGEKIPGPDTIGEEVYFLLDYPDGISQNSHRVTLFHGGVAESNYIPSEQLASGIRASALDFSEHNFFLVIEEILRGEVALDNYAPKVGDTLTATAVGYNYFGVFQYRWLRDGVPINDWSTKGTYTLTAADLMHEISCEAQSITGEPLDTIVSEKTAPVDVSMGESYDYSSSYIAYFEGVTSGMQYSTNGGISWTDVPGDGVLSGNRFYVKTPGTYLFRTRNVTDAKYWTEPIEVEGWYIIGYNIETGTDTTSGTVTFKNGSTTLTGSTNTNDIKAYGTNRWRVRVGATTNITMTVKPASSSYAHVSLNGGSYSSSGSERTFTVSPVNSHKIYTIVFNKSSSSPRTADMSHLGMWSALCFVSLVGTATMVKELRRRRKNER